MTLWVSAGAAIGAAAISGTGAYLGGKANADAISSANAQNAVNLRAQAGFNAQSQELSRPLIQTRDNALNTLNAVFGLPQVQPSLQRSQGSGTALVRVPHVTAKSRASGAPDARADVYYDPVNGTFTDVSGAEVARAPEGGGTVPGLTGHKNNEVRVDAQGRVFSAGNSGAPQIFTLPERVTPEPVAEGAAPNGVQSLADLVNTPQLEFELGRANQGAERLLNARGLRNSGRELGALQELNAGIVGSRVDDVVNNLFRMAGFGNTATPLVQQSIGNMAGATGVAGNNAANLALAGGNARSSTYENFGDIGSGLARALAEIFANQQPKAASPPTINPQVQYSVNGTTFGGP